MAMFDYYEPVPALSCPVCRGNLAGWQGKDGPCALLVWRQGFQTPVGQNVMPECLWSAEEMKGTRLPTEFFLYSDDCDCPEYVEAIGRTDSGTWVTTELVTTDNTNQRPHERRSEYKARLARLRSSGG